MNTECLVFPAGRAHRFYIFRSGGGVGFCRIGDRCSFVYDVNFLGAQHRPRLPGAIRNHFGRGGYKHVFLAGSHKHRYDHGLNAGGWRAFALYQLRGIIGFNHCDRNWFVDECQHAAVYA